MPLWWGACPRHPRGFAADGGEVAWEECAYFDKDLAEGANFDKDVELAQIKTEYMERCDVGQFMIVESYGPGAPHDRGIAGGGPPDDPRPQDV